jgi:outer membrane receptor for ferrienterochelin and colicin
VKYGVLDNTSKTFYSKFRSDFSIPLTNTIDFASGVEYEYNKLRNNGIVPIFSYNIRPDAPSFTLSQKNNAGRFGLYSEAKFKILNNLNAITGVRGDYYTISKEFAFDPRLSVVYRISDNSFLRGAIGIYHQNPGLQSFSYSGSNDLKPERAIHYILGYEFNSENDVIFRVESYYKDYKNLISTSLYNYSLNSDGYGSAKGVDVFFKLRTKSGFNGWISYAYTDSKRKQFGSLGLTSADFDITNNLAIVATYDFGNNYVAGATYRISTGKPYTPVSGSYYDSLQAVFVPVYGDRNSDRFPAFQRVDLNFQHFFSMFNRFVVVFASLTNLLNQENLYAYTYNFDYSQKIKVRSTNPRTFYMGFGVQL